MNQCVKKQPYKWLYPIVYKNTKVILLSWNLYEDISKVVKREQVLICPNGIPKITESNNIKERDNLEPRLLFLSNLIESKGVYLLLDACKILKEKGYKFVCDYVGGETKEINRFVFEESVKSRKLDGYVVYPSDRMIDFVNVWKDWFNGYMPEDVSLAGKMPLALIFDIVAFVLICLI